MNTITEKELLANYERYVISCEEDGACPKTYPQWRDWFLFMFDARVIEQPLSVNVPTES